MESTPLTPLNPLRYRAARLGSWSSLILAGLTFITFTAAMTAVPKSGPACTGNCLEYPFLESLAYYPGDYYWMFLSVFQLCIWVVWMVSVHYSSDEDRRIYSFAGISFGVIAATVLLADYFIQFAVVPVSLMKGETQGIALITQYNDHGIFIALEELGYLLMSVSFLFMARVFGRGSRLGRSLRKVLTAPFVLTITALAACLVRYGADRSYRFEIPAISFNWLVMIIGSVMAALYFRRMMKKRAA